MKIVPYFALGQFSAQPRHLGGAAAARGRQQFSRHLAGAQNADRRVLPFAYVLMLIIAIALSWQGGRAFLR
jgi:hypothetical protein